MDFLFVFKIFHLWKHLKDDKMDLGETNKWKALQFLRFVVRLDLYQSLLSICILLLKVFHNYILIALCGRRFKIKVNKLFLWLTRNNIDGQIWLCSLLSMKIIL